MEVTTTTTPEAPLVPPATPAATETPALATPPRDPNTGRFSKANLYKAMGMEDPASTPAVATVETPAATTPEVPQNTAVVPPATDDPLAALDAFLATPEVAPAQTPATPEAQVQQTPAFTPQTPEAQQVYQWAQNPNAAGDAIRYVQMGAQLEGAIERGDVGAILGAFAPQVVEALKAHIYEAEKDQWAQRYMDEANGVKADPRVDMLLRELNTVKQGLQSRQQQEQQFAQQQRQQQQAQQIQAGVKTYVDKMFDQVKGAVTPEQRSLLEPAMYARLRANAQAMQNIRAGRYGDIGKVFREIFTTSRSAFVPVLPPQQTAKPNGATTLMTSPAGTATTSGSTEVPLVQSGRINGKALVTKLRDYLGKNKAS